MKNFFRKTMVFSKGFTLIELLIVIAILGVLAAGILVAIDPVDKISQANDAKVQNDISNMGRSSERYAVLHNGFYPFVLNDLVASGELKRVSVAPSGYVAYAVTNTPSPCAAGTTCTDMTIYGQLKSKRYTSTPWYHYETNNGKACAQTTVTTACP